MLMYVIGRKVNKMNVWWWYRVFPNVLCPKLYYGF